MNNFDKILEGIASGELLANPDALLSMVDFYVAIVVAAILVLTAIYGYRIFRITFAASVCVACGMLGDIPASLILASLPNLAIEGVNLSAIVGIVFAAIGLLLGAKFYKFTLFLSCAAGSYFMYQAIAVVVAAMFPDLAFLSSSTTLIVASAALALLTGVLMLLLFKPIYIIITSVGGVALATALLLFSIAPGYPVMALAGLVIGAILGIPAAVHQFKCDAK